MKYYTLSRDYQISDPKQQFSVDSFIAEDDNKAWEHVELEMMNSDIQVWLLTLLEMSALCTLLNKKFEEML